MKVNSEECEALLSSGDHHVSDLEDMAGDSMYSPTRKASKSEAMSRVHCIPVLMVFVFFVLWAASSEVKPDLRMATATRSEVHRKVGDDEVALPGGRTMLVHEVESSHWNRVDPSLENETQGIDGPQKSYIRGNARQLRVFRNP